jgi:hypothetical protein
MRHAISPKPEQKKACNNTEINEKTSTNIDSSEKKGILKKDLWKIPNLPVPCGPLNSK